MPPLIVVLATLDTKGEEAVFLRQEIEAAGGRVRVVDVGVGEAAVPSHVTADQIASSAGTTIEQVRALSREEAMTTMGQAAGEQLLRWHAKGQLDGVLAVGGNQGTAVAAMAMRALPVGPAKLIISTVASGNVRRYVADSDIAMQFSVADLLGGPNRITSTVLRKAAAGIVAMAGVRTPAPASTGSAIAVTAFGNTEPAVVAAMTELRARGFDVIPFHASGACGSAMERLVDEGHFHAVLDLTTHEVLGELHPEDIYAPVRAGRLTAASRQGVAQVVAPGGLEYFCFGGVEDIPPAYRGRPTHVHNRYNTNVRTTADELTQVGELVAERLNASNGPVSVLIPMQGWSQVGSPGGLLHDPDANAAFVTVLQERLRPGIDLRQLDTEINDERFAVEAAQTLVAMTHDSNLVPPVA